MFCVADGFYGYSWTLQCEIIQHDVLGAKPADEEVPPFLQNGQELPFDFIDLGQPILQEGFDMNLPQPEQGYHDANNVDNGEWDEWSQVVPPALVQQPEQEELINSHFWS